MEKKANWREAVAVATDPADLALSLVRQMIFLLSSCLSSLHSHPCGVGVLPFRNETAERLFARKTFRQGQVVGGISPTAPSWRRVVGNSVAAELWALFLPLCKITQPTPTRFFSWLLLLLRQLHCINRKRTTLICIAERRSLFLSLSWPSLWPHSKYSKPLHLHFIGVPYLNYIKHKYVSHTVGVMKYTLFFFFN